MAYLLIGIALYSISIFWIGVADPWINAQFEEQRRDRAGREEEREEETKQEERPKVGDFDDWSGRRGSVLQVALRPLRSP
jgi:hypothetical protein